MEQIDYTIDPGEEFPNEKEWTGYKKENDTTHRGNLNLQDLDVRNFIRRFEKELEEAIKKPLKYVNEYYGKLPKIKGNNIVENDILGYIHAGIVQYCEEREIIIKKKHRFGDSWMIRNKGGRLNYHTFSIYYSALSLLKANREQAGKIDREDFNNMLRMK